MQMYYDDDANLDLLGDKTVAIIGYGSQGHAHSLNLKESGVNVVVGLREGSSSRAAAEKEGLKVASVAEAAKEGDVVMILINDEVQRAVFEADIKSNLSAGNSLAFAHGINIHFGQVVPPADAPGHVFHQYVILADDRDGLKAHLDGAEIGSAIYYPIPLHLQPCFADLRGAEGDLPACEKLAGRVLALPIHPGVTSSLREEVVAAVAAFYS